MSDREKVLQALEHCDLCSDMPNCPGCAYLRESNCIEHLKRDIIALLKAQEPTTTEPKRIDLPDETKAWLDKMDAVDALGNIADICIDWDGYRTADGLGGLINEIWAYARYCADRLQKAQEPVSVQKKPMEMGGLQTWNWACGNCGQTVLFSAKILPVVWKGGEVGWM